MSTGSLDKNTLCPPLAWAALLAAVLVAILLKHVYVEFILLAPLYALIGIAALFFWNLSRNDNELPIVDLGVFYMLGIVAYGALPLVWHLLSGMHLTALSHIRLYRVDPAPDEFAEVGWMHVVFALSFGCTYLALRKARPHVSVGRMEISGITPKLLLLMLLTFQGYFFYVKVSAGVDYSAAYNDYSVYDQAENYQQLGLVQQQFIAHPYGMLGATKIGLIIWLTANWGSPVHRCGVIAVFAYSLVSYLLAPGGRYALISMFLAAFLTYHQTVQRIHLRRVFLFSALLMFSFFFANVYRIDANNELLDSILDNMATGFSISNEFQISYGSILELQHNLTSGLLADIPWQVYAQEILLVIPQQLLPFEKVDPVGWYVTETNNIDYFSYGVIAESVLGFGFAELAVRGFLTGAIFAAVHNWWSGTSDKFWPTFFYMWLLIVVYQSFRNTSMHIVPLIMYQWVPVYAFVLLLESVFQPATRSYSSEARGWIHKENAAQS